MKSLLVLAFIVVAGQCDTIRFPRDVSELLYSNPNVQTRPIYQQQDSTDNGYNYPKPELQPRPIYRDPEPTLIQPRPIYRVPEPTWVQPRPTNPSFIRPIYEEPEQNFIQTRPIYRPQENIGLHQQSEKLLWPLFNKIAGIFSPYPSNGYYPGSTGGYPGSTGGYPGSNSIGYPGYPGNYPSYPSKFSVLGGLFPGHNYNYQRIETSPATTISESDDASFQNTHQSGFGIIGDAAATGEGYHYPNPNEQQPPLDLPGGLQFKAQPVEHTDNSN